MNSKGREEFEDRGERATVLYGIWRTGDRTLRRAPTPLCILRSLALALAVVLALARSRRRRDSLRLYRRTEGRKDGRTGR